MSGLLTRVNALESSVLAEGEAPASTAIVLRVQALEDILLGERSEGALLGRIQALEEMVFGQSQGGPPQGTPQTPPGGRLQFAQQAAARAAPIDHGVIDHGAIDHGDMHWPAEPADVEPIEPMEQIAPAATPVPPGAESGRVFVGDLPPDVEAEELEVTFAAFGGVNGVHVMRGKAASGRSCAFVVLDSWQAGEAAIGGLSGVCSLREGDQPMVVSWPKSQTAKGQDPNVAVRFSKADTSSRAAPRPPANGGQGSATKLFVGNLPQEVQKEALQEVFGTYGVVIDIHVMTGKSASGQSCAFVEYSTPVEAETAIHHLHDKYETLPGQGNIIVRHANAGPGKGGRPAPY